MAEHERFIWKVDAESVCLWEDSDPRWSLLEDDAQPATHTCGQVAASIYPTHVGGWDIKLGTGDVAGPNGMLVLAEMHHIQN